MIFKQFAIVCGLEIDTGSIKSGDEIKKEPDILCQLLNGSKLAFELTEAVDSRVPRRDAVCDEAEKIWKKHYNSLSPNDKLRFDCVCDGGIISLKISDHTSKSNIQKAIPILIKKLKDRCRDQLGLIKWISKDEFPLPEGCDHLTIEAQEAKPKFRCSRAGCISPGFVLNKIEKKFLKSYESSNPIHLLVYDEHHSFGPDCLWIDKTKQYVEKNLKDSPFERVWVFDRCSQKIVYVFPNSE